MLESQIFNSRVISFYFVYTLVMLFAKYRYCQSLPRSLICVWRCNDTDGGVIIERDESYTTLQVQNLEEEVKDE